jgi:flavin reductase (DIM6/NTAB) family NADH-FMN oxidoreductase RutF
MAAFAGPVLGFGCNTTHATLRNLVATREFVVNVPGVALVERVWQMLDSHGADRVARSGLTLGSAQTVAAPVVLECAAYAECRLRNIVEFEGGEVFVFGTLTAIGVDSAARRGDPADRHAALAPFFFVEDGWYAPLGTARSVATVRDRHR